MEFTDERFGSLMKEMVRTEGEELLKVEETWHAAVPKSTDEAAMAAIGTVMPFAAPAAGSAAAGHAAAGAAVGKAVKTAAVALAALAVVAVGAVTVSPTLRDNVSALLTGGNSSAVSQSVHQGRAVPGDYMIPSPGEGFTVTQAVDDERLLCRWFTSDVQELMVQVAYKLPAEIAGAEGSEPVRLGETIAAVYFEQGEQKIVELRDGEIVLQVEYFNAEKDEVLAYAALLAEVNGIG